MLHRIVGLRGYPGQLEERTNIVKCPKMNCALVEF